jgi:predicted dithiol-disulfide oxidoreductase (DUF899 family)
MDHTNVEHQVVSQEEWLRAQAEFEKKEAEFTKLSADLSEARRKLPWLRVEKPYTFQSVDGPESLSDLFQGRHQLVMQHFMFSPEWKEGCSGCSVQADGVDGPRYHFEPKDVSFVAVSRAPVEKLQAFKERMGWKFKWVSSLGSDFNYDFTVSFTPEQLAKGRAQFGYSEKPVDMADLPAVSVFYKNDKGEIFRTYSNYGTGSFLLSVYDYLDLTPMGRNEKSYFDWIKHHDKY